MCPNREKADLVQLAVWITAVYHHHLYDRERVQGYTIFTGQKYENMNTNCFIFILEMAYTDSLNEMLESITPHSNVQANYNNLFLGSAKKKKSFNI